MKKKKLELWLNKFKLIIKVYGIIKYTINFSETVRRNFLILGIINSETLKPDLEGEGCLVICAQMLFFGLGNI